MILASSGSGLIGFLVITGVIMCGLGLWLFVLGLRFLISGRKAFDRYLLMTDTSRHGPAVVHPPTDPSGSSPHTTWRTKGSQM